MEKHYQQYLLFTKCLEIVDKYATISTKYELIKNVIKIINDARIIGPGASNVLRKNLQQHLTIKHIFLPTVAKKFAKEIIDIMYSPIKLEKEGKLVVKKEKDGTSFTYKNFTQILGDCHYDSWTKHSNDETITSILMEFANILHIVGGMVEAQPTAFIKGIFNNIKNEAKKYYELTFLASFSVATHIDKDVQLSSTELEIQKGFGVTHQINQYRFDDNCIIILNLFISIVTLYAIIDKIIIENKDHHNLTILIYRYVRHSGDIKYKSDMYDIDLYTPSPGYLRNLKCEYITVHGSSENVHILTSNEKIIEKLKQK